MDDLLTEFLTETGESLAELDVAVLQLERVPGHYPTITMIFRLVHTIKGTCGFLGLGRLEKVAHAAENVLCRLRDNEMVATPALVTVILSALDGIKSILAGIASTGAEPEGDDSALIARLEQAERGDETPEEPATSPKAGPVKAAKAPAKIVAKAVKALPKPPASAAAPASAPAMAIEPPVAAAAPAAAPVAATVPAPAEPAEPGAGGPHTIRVAVDVLESLMTLVSELVLTRNQLLQIARVQGQQEGEEATAVFVTPLQRLSQITSDLQEGVMKTRMQPIGNAWSKLPRLVRDLANELGKRIELVTTGAETELDRQVLELIRDPLTHMVRNSADHGIERPEDRRAAGKPETGQIKLSAFHEGGHIVIGLADDGRGLDVARIRAKAVSRGLGTEAELAAMPDSEVQRFIFHPGFSTAEAITSVSGRGVGMDVVMTNIERIGGAVDLRSRFGEGTNFTIKIPLTLAIVSALIVEAAGERFAIPQLTVAELVSPKQEGDGPTAEGETRIARLNGTPVLRLRDRLLPLVSLAELLRLEPPASQDTAAAHPRHVIVAQASGGQLGIVVDRVFDTEEIVVKPVTPILRHLTVFGGTTILGDGSVIMILDPGGIARAAGTAGDGRSDERTDGRQDERQVGGSGGSGIANLAHSDDRTAILLFRAGGALMAVPLGLVARLEEIPRDRIEFADISESGAVAVTQYRGQLMPLVPIAGTFDRDRAIQRVLVFSEHGETGGSERSMGLVVDEIVDVVDERLQIAMSSTRPGLLGTAVIDGRAAGVLDTRYWLTQQAQDWFRARQPATSSRQSRLLIVEDSDFFRQLLIPTLSAAGFVVTAAAGAAQALKLRDSGAMFDAIVSDIEMPELDGLAFARRVRAGGAWLDLPMIALSGRARPKDIAAAREAGFTDFVEKFEPEPLLECIRRCLANAGAPALQEAA